MYNRPEKLISLMKGKSIDARDVQESREAPRKRLSKSCSKKGAYCCGETVLVGVEKSSSAGIEILNASEIKPNA